ncbi:MAG: cytochrome c3 family protein [Deltaproteobacteria bacterium]|nr:cytochrome c3 family protein [Deltaproteobacteria bacterium]
MDTTDQLYRLVRLVVWLPLILLVTAGCEIGDLGGTQRGYEPVQPIAYSHKVHAGDYKMACLYCHYAAERGRHAGVPAASLCMNCHTQVKKDSPEVQKLAAAVESDTPIQWVRVHRFPAHSHFNHARHVAGGELKCQTCHGPIETMDRVRQEHDMTMGFCLDCHRQTAQRVATAPAPSTDCTACHY